jgi:hypothetical protein
LKRNIFIRVGNSLSIGTLQAWQRTTGEGSEAVAGRSISFSAIRK